MNHLKSLFFLDPSVIFLNHGSFGACPRPVMKNYQDWQRRLERQPVAFLGREFNRYDRQARQALAGYLQADPDDLAFIPNATHGVNIVARSLELGPGDEILATNHEYGACDNAWRFISKKTGAAYIRQPIPLPVCSEEDIVEQLWAGVNSHTRLIFLSHITSPTALRFPIEEICRRAQEAHILTLIDGAHAPGQIPLDLFSIGADFYTGNCHKWMLSPKGAGFLYTRREVQSLVEPLVVSWGYSATQTTTTGSTYIDNLAWTGTRDPAATFSVPTAIQFMDDHNWQQVRQDCYELLTQTIQRITDLTGLQTLYPPNSDFYRQMAVVPLPPFIDPVTLKIRLYDEFHIEIPVHVWNELPLMRISVQGYNTPQDMEALLQALQQLLPGRS